MSHNATDGGQESVNVYSVEEVVATPITGPFVYLTGRRMGLMRWCPFAASTTMMCMMGTPPRLPPCVKSDPSTCGWSGSTIRGDVGTKDRHTKEKEDE